MSRHFRSRPRARRRSWEQIQPILDAYRQSELTQREFARQKGVGYSTFTQWLRRERSHGTGEAGSGWVMVEAKDPAAHAGKMGEGYLLEGRGGWRLRLPTGFDVREVEQIVRILAQCSE